MKFRKLTAIFAVASLCAGSLAGSTVVWAAESGEEAEITFQTWNPDEAAGILDLIDQFEKENPGIKVNYTYMPYTDHVEKLKVDMASGTGADVFGMQTGASIREFRDFEMDLTSYAQEEWGENWTDKFLDSGMSLLEEDGEYYGLPLGQTYAGFAWADYAMLQEYGLEIPTSLDNLKEAAAVLRENGQFPLGIGAKDAWINIDTWMSIANDINSEKLYSALEGETPFTDEDMVEAFRIWQSLFTDGIVQDGALGVSVYNDMQELFEREGSIPLYLNGSWTAGCYLSGDTAINETFNKEGADHRVFLIDWNNDGKVAPVTVGVDVVLCMNKNTEYPEAAWKFINFMLHTGQNFLVNQRLIYFPSRTDLELKVEGMSENGSQNLDYIQEQAVSNVAGYREMSYVDLKQTISDMLTALALGDVTPEEAGETVEAASQAQER